jgi:hypothetical protein
VYGRTTESGRPIKRSGRLIKKQPAPAWLRDQQPRSNKPKAGSRIKKHERTIIPFGARAGKKSV